MSKDDHMCLDHGPEFKYVSLEPYEALYLNTEKGIANLLWEIEGSEQYLARELPSFREVRFTLVDATCHERDASVSIEYV